MKTLIIITLLISGLNIYSQSSDEKRSALNYAESSNLNTKDYNGIISFIDMHQYKKALKRIDFLLQSNSNEPLLYYFKGFIYNNQGKSLKAINNLTIALSFDSTRYEFYREMGAALNDKKEFNKALTFLNKSSELYSNDEHVYALKSFAKGGLQDYSGALVEIEKALVINPNLKLYNDYKSFLIELIKNE